MTRYHDDDREQGRQPAGPPGPDDLRLLTVDAAHGLRAVLGDTTECGLTLLDDDRLVSGAPAGSRAQGLDVTQHDSLEGPGLDSLRTGRPVELSDAGADARWPAFLPTAVAMGLRCAVSVPLVEDGAAVGALTVYGFDRPHAFDEAERRTLEQVALRTASLLRIAQRQDLCAALLAGWEEALGRRAVVDQAVGILMAQRGCSQADATSELARRAHVSGRAPREVAAALVRATAEAGAPSGGTYGSDGVGGGGGAASG